MEVIAVPQRGQLVWDDFTWLNDPAPVPTDTVIEPPADPLLSGICEGVLISDRAFVKSQSVDFLAFLCRNGHI